MGNPSLNKGLWIAGTLAVLVAAFSVVLFWQIGGFDLPDSDPGAKAFTAVLTLLGGLFASVLTFVSVLLRLSYDDRTRQMQQDAYDRKAELDRQTLAIQQEAEERQKVDTYVRGLGLLSTPSGNEPSRAQRAAALLALANLGQMKFALGLLEQMWSAGEVAPSSSVWLINEGLEEGLKHHDNSMQIQAARILNQHAKELKDYKVDSSHLWPSCLASDWKLDFDQRARVELFRALLRCLSSRPFKVWDGSVLNDVIYLLNQIRSDDTDERIKNGAILTLDVILDFDQRSVDIFNEEGEPLNKGTLRKEVKEQADQSKTSRGFRELINQLRDEWKSSDKPQSTSQNR
jgi:hypothetical protein